MPDNITTTRRSEIMSHIKSKDTSIELLVRHKLHSLGFRYKVNYPNLPGKPDVVFTKKRIVIFVHGCFWHGHDIGCRFSHISQSRKEYWEPKIARTKERDMKSNELLLNNGWLVLTIWECEIKQHFDNVIANITDTLNKREQCCK